MLGTLANQRRENSTSKKKIMLGTLANQRKGKQYLKEKENSTAKKIMLGTLQKIVHQKIIMFGTLAN